MGLLPSAFLDHLMVGLGVPVVGVQVKVTVEPRTAEPEGVMLWMLEHAGGAEMGLLNTIVANSSQ